MLKGKRKEIEGALFLLHQHLRGNFLPITGPILQEKALQFFRLLKGEDSEFTPHEGWLDRFKKRLGVLQITVSGEVLSADEEDVPLFKAHLAKLMQQEEITRGQLCNCDETGLN